MVVLPLYLGHFMAFSSLKSWVLGNHRPPVSQPSGIAASRGLRASRDRRRTVSFSKATFGPEAAEIDHFFGVFFRPIPWRLKKYHPHGIFGVNGLGWIRVVWESHNFVHSKSGVSQSWGLNFKHLPESLDFHVSK